MRVYDAKEIKSLDEDLDLFSEDDWDFNRPATGLAYDYYDNLYDADVTRVSRITVIRYVAAVILLVGFCMAAVILFTLQSGVLDNRLYHRLSGLDTSEDSSKVEVIDGEKATDQEIVEVSRVLTSYFNTLRSESGYSNLNDLCTSGSTFFTEYQNYVKGIASSYDISDCHARLFAKIGGMCQVSKVDSLIEQDGKYYCYVLLSLPMSQDVSEFVYLNTYNYTKHFASTDKSESAIIQYTLDLMDLSKVSCTTQTYCIIFERDARGGFYILDDSLIAEVCAGAYDVVNSTVINVLGDGVIGF